MPILDTYHARTIMVIKRSMAPGFAGIDNELYYNEKTMMLCGMPRAVLSDLVGQLSHSAAMVEGSGWLCPRGRLARGGRYGRDPGATVAAEAGIP